MHRRVITETNEIHQPSVYKYEQKIPAKVISKPKFIDAYSKYVAKESISQRKNFKINPNKHPGIDKNMKT